MESNSIDGALLSPKATQIELHSGAYFDVTAPDPRLILLDDIAHALSLTCRYGGHVKRFYSVAEHSCLVFELLRHCQRKRWDALPDSDGGRELSRAALLHDAAEAYLGDVVAPLKYALRAGEGSSRVMSSVYDRMSYAVDMAVAERFGFRGMLLQHDTVKLCDLWAMRIEATRLTASGGATWRWPGELPFDGEPPPQLNTRCMALGLDPPLAKMRFLMHAHDLGLGDDGC